MRLFILPACAVILFLSCSGGPVYELDYTNFSIDTSAYSRSSVELHEASARETSERGFVFSFEGDDHNAGEGVLLSITNDGSETYYLCSERTKFDFDTDGDGWVSMASITDHELVSADPEIAGRIDDMGIYLITIHFVFPANLAEDEREDFCAFAPGEQLRFNLRLPPVEGRFQVRLHAVSELSLGPWGLGSRYLFSEIFEIR